MEDISTRITRLHRPRLLVEAARSMADLYDRNRDLPPLLGDTPRSGAALMQLLDLEAAHDAARKARARSYRLRAHIAVLIALMGEDRVMKSALPGPIM